MAAIDWPAADWQVAADGSVDWMTDLAIAHSWIETVQEITGLPRPTHGAQLLWMRGIRSAEALRGFWRAADYQPASPFEFGEEMLWAVDRLIVARDRTEKVAIWGDFDADGITSTAVLWDGLRQFFPHDHQLTYFIPNRLKESHGLSMVGIAQLSAQGVGLIVTCDTGSTNPTEIEYARSLGMDVIVTDHHTLPAQRPAVVAIVNPRALPPEHAMASLSGVAVAYKLIEALYEKLPDVPKRPLSELVDLVAIGLIADLVELKGDCRYLAQIGIAQLQTHLKATQPTRPGVAKLLTLCRRAGDRPTDISFGLGPRINAVSRIYGEASFCVELLTSQDAERCRELAGKAELANARRKALQSDVLQQVNRQLEHRDMSTMSVIVLFDAQWPVGVLGLVAGQVAQQYGRPTILLSQDISEQDISEQDISEQDISGSDKPEQSVLIRGSARSVNQIDLYDLVDAQSHLLTGFGGHPFAAGLSLPLENLSLFRAAINQQYRQKMGPAVSVPVVKADLVVTVSELGKDLFQELKLLEPCGMGNPVPKLLIENCWFDNVWHQKLKDRMGSKVGYIKANFQLCDKSGPEGTTAQCPGLWWGHYKDDLPPGRWDVVAELDYNSHPRSRRYEVRLIAIRPAVKSETADAIASKDRVRPNSVRADWLLDFRRDRTIPGEAAPAVETALVLDQCPVQWQDLRLWQHQSEQTAQPLALAYEPPTTVDPIEKWKQLLGIAKYLSREQVAVSRERLGARLLLSDRTLTLGFSALERAGFEVKRSAIDIRFGYSAKNAQLSDSPADSSAREAALGRFLLAIQEETFRRQYFYQAPVSTLQAAMNAET
ncbi:MAG: single-stranded-DNA-specific exonuclease RecJ [Phormidesmis sp.]